MELEPRICANMDCERLFEPQVHNAIYCSVECRKVITNKNVLDRYYENKERRSNKKRICNNPDCNTILSTYNSENICEACKTERLIRRLSSWGWDEDKLREDWSY
jgi:hypothetical protein